MRGVKRPPGERLRSLLGVRGPLLLPGVFDALSARLAAAAGFEAIYMSGFGVSASRSALPDAGLLTMTEMVDEATAIVDATSLPRRLTSSAKGRSASATVAFTQIARGEAALRRLHGEEPLS